MSVQDDDLETKVLNFLSYTPIITAAFGNAAALAQIKASCPQGSDFLVEENLEQVQQVLWILVSRGLAYFNTMSWHHQQWRYIITDRGRSVVNDKEPNPDDPTGYIKRLKEAVPNTSNTVEMYLRESLHAYSQQCFLASTVMLGVAAEACTLEAAGAYVQWADGTAPKLEAKLADRTGAYVDKLNGFVLKLETDKPHFPKDLPQNIKADIEALLEIIRVTRNESGHPSGVQVDRPDCYSRLAFYATAHKKLYAFKSFFEENKKQRQIGP